MIKISHVPGFVFDLEKPSLNPKEMQDTVLVFFTTTLGAWTAKKPNPLPHQTSLDKLSG